MLIIKVNKVKSRLKLTIKKKKKSKGKEGYIYITKGRVRQITLVFP
jgi:hypothetical protein